VDYAGRKCSFSFFFFLLFLPSPLADQSAILGDLFFFLSPLSTFRRRPSRAKKEIAVVAPLGHLFPFPFT